MPGRALLTGLSQVIDESQPEGGMALSMCGRFLSRGEAPAVPMPPLTKKEPLILEVSKTGWNYLASSVNSERVLAFTSSSFSAFLSFSLRTTSTFPAGTATLMLAS